MINIVLVCDNHYNYWRVIRPLNHIRNFALDLRLIGPPDLSNPFKSIVNRNDIIEAADIVFMHRPYNEDHVAIFNKAKYMKKKIWIDYDDNLYEVPHDNKTWGEYNNKEHFARMDYMIANAHAVTTSTQPLNDYISKKRQTPATLIRNAWDNEYWDYFKLNDRDDGKIRILWRGSEHHQKDLMHVKDQIIEVANTNPDVQWFFVGFRPWFITEYIENWFHVDNSEIHTYHKTLHALKPDIVMVPLVDNIFNRCKSNIGAIEGSLAGGMLLVPDFEEWRHIPGAFHYHKDNPSMLDFGDSLKYFIKLIKDTPHTTKVWAKESVNYFIENGLDKENTKRVDIINSLYHS